MKMLLIEKAMFFHKDMPRACYRYCCRCYSARAATFRHAAEVASCAPTRFDARDDYA